MLITEYLHKDPDEYERWEMKDDNPKWDQEVHVKIHYRLYEVKVNADISEDGVYSVLSFEVDGKVFKPVE